MQYPHALLASCKSDGKAAQESSAYFTKQEANAMFRRKRGLMTTSTDRPQRGDTFLVNRV